MNICSSSKPPKKMGWGGGGGGGGGGGKHIQPHPLIGLTTLKVAELLYKVLYAEGDVANT